MGLIMLEFDLVKSANGVVTDLETEDRAVAHSKHMSYLQSLRDAGFEVVKDTRGKSDCESQRDVGHCWEYVRDGVTRVVLVTRRFDDLFSERDRR